MTPRQISLNTTQIYRSRQQSDLSFLRRYSRTIRSMYALTRLDMAMLTEYVRISTGDPRLSQRAIARMKDYDAPTLNKLLKRGVLRGLLKQVGRQYFLTLGNSMRKLVVQAKEKAIKTAKRLKAKSSNLLKRRRKSQSVGDRPTHTSQNIFKGANLAPVATGKPEEPVLTGIEAMQRELEKVGTPEAWAKWSELQAQLDAQKGKEE